MFNFGWAEYIDWTLCSQVEKFGLSVNSEPRWKKHARLGWLFRCDVPLPFSRSWLRLSWRICTELYGSKKWRSRSSTWGSLMVLSHGHGTNVLSGLVFEGGMAQGDTHSIVVGVIFWVMEHPWSFLQCLQNVRLSAASLKNRLDLRALEVSVSFSFSRYHDSSWSNKSKHITYYSSHSKTCIGQSFFRHKHAANSGSSCC